MLKIEVSAPGKTILHGEHAVVFGKAAIATSLGLKTKASLVSSSNSRITLNLCLLKLKLQWEVDAMKALQCNDENLDIIPPTEGELLRISNFLTETVTTKQSLTEFQRIAVTIFLYLYSNVIGTYDNSFSSACEIKVESELCLGAGMGSSASYSVCLAALLLAACKAIKPNLLAEDLDRISRWAFCSETICHGWPSGIDNSICTYGGALLFQNKKIVSQLSSMPPLQVLLVSTGVARNTKVLVAGVKQKMNSHPCALNHVLDAIHAITLESWDILNKMQDECTLVVHLSPLQDLIGMNHHLLNCLGVGHPKLNMICEIAQENGFAAKLTGAGGGGCAFIVIPPAEGDVKNMTKNLKAGLETAGFEYWEVALGGKGVELNIFHS